VKLRKISEKYHFLIDQWQNIFDIYVTEYGTALTTILPILFLYLNTVIVTAADDSTLLDIQTRLSDKKKREISDCLNDTLTNLCGQKFAKTTLPSNTENMSNVGSNENNSSNV
jgi:hypothetical protein